MTRTASSDAVRALARDLSIIDLDVADPLPGIVEQARFALATESVVLFTMRPEADAVALDGFAIAGKGRQQLSALRIAFEPTARRPWSVFDPREVAVAQRNRIYEPGSFAKLMDGHMPAPLSRSITERDREERVMRLSAIEPCYALWGVRDAQHLRVLACDGARLTAYIGLLQADRFEARQRTGFQVLVGPLRRRLAFVERWSAPPTRLLMDALLEEIPSAAFLVDGDNRIVAFNRAAAAHLSRANRETSVQVRDARRRNGTPRHDVVDLAARGVPRHALVIEKSTSELPRGAIDRARSRFGWTPREAEIAAHIAAGRTNRAVATHLRCSERTVETHVSRLLGKSDCPSRSALAAAIWSLAGGR